MLVSKIPACRGPVPPSCPAIALAKEEALAKADGVGAGGLRPLATRLGHKYIRDDAVIYIS
jgi:hypothetical protein